MKSRFGTGILIILLMVSCTSRNREDLYATPDIICAADTMTVISFTGNIQPIFSQNCALAGCHDAISKTGGLNLDSVHAYQSLIQAGSGYIDTADPGSSLLYSQMRSVSNPMPPTGPLDTCITKLILKWITQKAPDN